MARGGLELITMQEGEPPQAKSRTRGACLSGVSDKVVVVVVVVVVQGKNPWFGQMCVAGREWKVEGSEYVDCFFPSPTRLLPSAETGSPKLDDLKARTCLQRSVKFQMTLHCSQRVRTLGAVEMEKRF